MTALNAILRPDAAYFITDGQAWDGFLGQPGCESPPRPKVLPLPHLNAALGVRGCGAMLPALYSRIVHYRQTFEEAAASLGADLLETVTAVRAKVPDLADNDVALIGWPNWGDDPQCFLACDHGKWGIEPFRALRIPGLLAPNDGSLTERMGGREILSPGVEFDPETEAVALLKAQAAIPDAWVGAFAQITIVRRDGIETRILDLPDDEEQAPRSRREGLNALMVGS